MEKTVLKEAKRLKFFYQLSKENNWNILPKCPKETWKLTEADSRWILSIKNIPQLYLNSEEAIAFLAVRARVNCYQ